MPRSQILYFCLTTHPEAATDPSKPEQTLKLALSTADIELDGARLDSAIDDKFLSNKPQIVRSQSPGYSERHPDRVYISQIRVTPFAK